MLLLWLLERTNAVIVTPLFGRWFLWKKISQLSMSYRTKTIDIAKVNCSAFSLRYVSTNFFSRSRLYSTPDQTVMANAPWVRASPKRLKQTSVPSKKKTWNLEQQRCSVQPSKHKPANRHRASCERYLVLITSLILPFREGSTSWIIIPIQGTIHRHHIAKCNAREPLAMSQSHFRGTKCPLLQENMTW